MSSGLLSHLPPLKTLKKKKGKAEPWKALVGSEPPYQLGSAFMRTERQAAEWLGVSIFTLRRIRKRKEIGCYQIGGGYYYDLQHLEAYVKSKELCPKNASKSETIGSPSTPTVLSTKPHGTTQPVDKHAALLLAQKTFKTPKQP